MLYLNLSAVNFGTGESGFEVEQLGAKRTWSHAVNERRLTLNADPKADCRHCPTTQSRSVESCHMIIRNQSRLHLCPNACHILVDLIGRALRQRRVPKHN